MPRMSRSVVIALLVTASCAFLLFQLQNHRKHASAMHVLGQNGRRTHNAQWHAVKRFLGVVRRLALPAFLADPAALQLITQDASPRRQEVAGCSFLCTGRRATAFAAIAGNWKYDHAAVTLAAAQSGLEVVHVRGRDPRLVVLGGEDDLAGAAIPLHFLFRSERGHIVQLVLLYQRGRDFLWHGPLRLQRTHDRGLAPPGLLQYGRHAGAYERVELVLTVLDGLDMRVPRNTSHFLFQRSHAHFLECRHGNARTFLQLYPDDPSPAAAEFRRGARSVLALAASTLRALGVPFWISSATCLGWYRQCGFISYSRDVDIGIWVRDFRPDMVAAFRHAGLPLKHKFGKVEDSLELSFQEVGGVKLDIFFFYDDNGDGDVVWNGGTQARTGRKFKYVFPRFSLCWAELAGVLVRAPCTTLDYVRANYGHDAWATPITTWDWKSSPANVLANGAWPPSEWDNVIQLY